MPYKNKAIQKKRQHELYLVRKELLSKAKNLLGIPQDRRKKQGLTN